MLKLGLDGWTEIGALPSDGCCAPSLDDVDPCILGRAMISLLPSGPLWDRAKIAGFAACAPRQDCHTVDDCGCACPPCDPNGAGATSLVGYAKFLGVMMYDVIADALLPSIREANPNTAVTTVDDWLDQYKWQSCFETLCNTACIGIAGPYVVAEGTRRLAFCPPNVPEPLNSAYRQALVRALSRLSRNPPHNLGGINWVISTLGARLTVDTGATLETGTATCCPAPRFCLSPTSDVLPLMDRHGATTDVQSWYRESCYLETKIRPGMLAAHCIALSMMQERGCDAYPPIRWCNCG